MLCVILVHCKIRHAKNEVTISFCYNVLVCCVHDTEPMYGGFLLTALYQDLKATQKLIQQRPYICIILGS